ncbi:MULTISPECIES: DUF547 domain-containing protein [unclassified Polaribacter]|uniref:DUF547 domain-containing protein n=1 Tax=unclassified Polaribacter TaxID=196858 RepID=UPI0011BF3F06|nr:MULTISPECIES: DUF547 domain-containing protein [unclassified Polaribacter]TXD52788.1 DUF547 domain-containing protein [Polaribacter sp. IC063]TXD61665.1 DUF547 domain-containing protein [Polaribacter sp. IC066]
MKQFLIFFFFLSTFTLNAQNNINYSQISKDLLQNIMTDSSYEKEVDLLAESTLNELVNELKTDQQKLAFWINIYNSFIQISLSENPKLYEDRGSFFGTPRVKIAGELLSFDNIEHDIIRKSRIKISLGYLRKWFKPKWERTLRVNTIDWRIHFALNCGAKSCPPVALYTAKNLDKELNFMATAYLKEQTTYTKETKTATSVALMSWFRGDFGGKCGAKKILLKYGITPEKPKNINFKSYDWTLLLGNYKTIPE